MRLKWVIGKQEVCVCARTYMPVCICDIYKNVCEFEKVIWETNYSKC